MKTPQLMCLAVLGLGAQVGEVARAGGVVPSEYGSPSALGCNENDFDFLLNTGRESGIVKKQESEFGVEAKMTLPRDRKTCSFRFGIWVPDGFRVKMKNLRLKGFSGGEGKGSVEVSVRASVLAESGVEKNLRFDANKNGNVDEEIFSEMRLSDCGKSDFQPLQILVNMIARADIEDANSVQSFSFESLEWSQIQYERCQKNEL